MPREDRRVIFDFSEMYKALYNLSLKQENAPQMIAGAIIKIEDSEDDKTKINVYLHNSQTGEKKVVVLTRDYIAAALMMYCRGLGIPLPRKAQKSIILEKDGVILRVLFG